MKTIKSQEVQSQEIGFMNKSELISVLTADLKAKDVQTIDQLFEFLTNNESFSSATASHAYREFLKKELADRASNLPEISESSKVGNYLSEKYSSLDQEEFIVLSVDNANKIISENVVALGTVDKVAISSREVFRTALANGAVAIFICHNHPSGKLLPSNVDFKITHKLQEAGEAINVPVLDHFIIGKGSYLSMQEEAMF